MTKDSQKNFTIAALIMSGSAIASRVLGFLREAVLAAQLGATGETDAYFAAFQIPDLLKYLLEGGALTFAFIPLFGAFLAQEKEEEAWDLFSNIATIMTAILGVFIVIAYIFTPVGVEFFFPGFNEEQTAKTIELTRIILPQPLLMVLGGLIVATEVAQKRFFASAMQPIIYNACIITGGILLAPYMGAAGFSWGVLAGAVLGSVLVPLIIARKNIRYRFRFHLNDPKLHEYIILALPLMFGVSLAMVDEWIGRYFASSLAEGSISWLNNARRLMQVPTGVIGQAIGYAALPYMVHLLEEGKKNELSSMLKNSLQATATLATIAALAVAIFANQIVQLAFQRGKFTAADTSSTGEILLIFSAGIISWSLYILVTRAFYAHKNTWTPMIASSIVALLTIPIYALLTSHFQIRGIAWSGVIGMTINIVVLSLVYKAYYRDNLLPAIGNGVLNGVIIGLPAAIAALGTLFALSLLPLSIPTFIETLLNSSISGGLFLLIALKILFVRNDEAAKKLRPKVEKIARKFRIKIGWLIG